LEPTDDKEDDMKVKLLLIAAPAALALGVLASAQSLGARPASAGERIDARPLPTPQLLGEIPEIDPRRWLPPKQVPDMPEQPPSVYQGMSVQYCTSEYNSTGYKAWLDHTGDMTCCSNNTCLQAYGVPASALGIFFFGTQPAQIPLGNGWLCVSPFYPGFYRLPSVTTTPWMTASTHVDLAALPPYAAISAGQTRYFQFWFRDPAAGGNQSNFSNGLAITFCK
jgi:hypothetical protein